MDPWGWCRKSNFNGDRGSKKAEFDLERNGYQVIAKEFTLRVNGARIRADFVARDRHGRVHVFEVKHGRGRLTRNQRKAGVYDLNSQSNTAAGLGGGVIVNSQATKGSFTVATSNHTLSREVGAKGDVINDVLFHVLKY